jgi:hypothetical protein
MGLPPIWSNAAKQSEEVIMLKFAALALVAAVTVGVASESMAKGGNGGGGGGTRMHSGGNYGGGGAVPSSSGGTRMSGINSAQGNFGGPGKGQVLGFPGGKPPVIGPIGPIGPKFPHGPVVTWPGGGIPPVVGPGGGGPKPVPPMQPPHHGHWHGGKIFVGGYQPAALYVPGNQECFQEQRRINGIVKLVKVCHEPN